MNFWADGGFEHTRCACMEPIQVPNVLWTTKLHPTFHQHQGEHIMTDFLFLGELFFFKSTYSSNKPLTAEHPLTAIDQNYKVFIMYIPSCMVIVNILHTVYHLSIEILLAAHNVCIHV